MAAVTSVAMYGSEIWWRGQKNRLHKVQLLLNSEARAITGLLRSTPRAFLQTASGLPSAQDLLNHRQTKFAMRALGADGDHPTHQLLPANFRFGELHRHEGATGQPSSVGWMRLEKTHRSFGSRLAQQIVKHVSRRARIVVQPNRAFVLVRAAADIEYFHTSIFITSRLKKLKRGKRES